jgi:hypothetical protein
MQSSNLGQFQLIALALMQIYCWLIKKDGEECELSITSEMRKNARGEG